MKNIITNLNNSLKRKSVIVDWIFFILFLLLGMLTWIFIGFGSAVFSLIMTMLYLARIIIVDYLKIKKRKLK
jgi:fatty acid desaturase